MFGVFDFVLLGYFVLSYFFFFKQKTAYEMRISDWSSDVCSSDLKSIAKLLNVHRAQHQPFIAKGALARRHRHVESTEDQIGTGKSGEPMQIGRASCRERVCKYV